MIRLKNLFLFMLVVALFADPSNGFWWRRRRRRRVPSLPRDSWVNTWDNPFTFQCPAGQSISRLRSIHSNHHEDRVWAFSCRKHRHVSRYRCFWTSYNGWDCPVEFKCPYGGFITGVSSYHSNHPEDRRYRFKCCDRSVFVRGRLNLCRWTDYKNGWDRELHYHVPRKYFLRGVYSEHNNKKEDRRWKFYICRKHSKVPRLRSQKKKPKVKKS